MLVLSRKLGEKINIGDHITITVLGVRGGVVKLGIDAPPQVRILRGELSEWIGCEPKEADEERPHEAEALAV